MTIRGSSSTMRIKRPSRDGVAYDMSDELFAERTANLADLADIEAAIAELLGY